jgi:hypothetical protein
VRTDTDNDEVRICLYGENPPKGWIEVVLKPTEKVYTENGAYFSCLDITGCRLFT